MCDRFEEESGARETEMHEMKILYVRYFTGIEDEDMP